MNGAGYTIKGTTGRFLLPEESITSTSNALGQLDKWPAGNPVSSTTARDQSLSRVPRIPTKNRGARRALGTAASVASSSRPDSRLEMFLDRQATKKTDGEASAVASSRGTSVLEAKTAKPRLLRELEHFLESELALLGETGRNPTSARLQVYRQAFQYFMEEFRTYKPFLSTVKAEYDALLDQFARRLHYIPPPKSQIVDSRSGIATAQTADGGGA